MQDFLDLDNFTLDFPSMTTFDMPSFFDEAASNNSLKRDRTSEEEELCAPPAALVEVQVHVAEEAAEPKSKKTKKRTQRKEQRRDMLEARVAKLLAENTVLSRDLQLLQKEDEVLSEQLALLHNAQARAFGSLVSVPAPVSGKLASNPAPMLMQCVPTIVSRSEIA